MWMIWMVEWLWSLVPTQDWVRERGVAGGRGVNVWGVVGANSGLGVWRWVWCQRGRGGVAGGCGANSGLGEGEGAWQVVNIRDASSHGVRWWDMQGPDIRRTKICSSELLILSSVSSYAGLLLHRVSDSSLSG